MNKKKLGIITFNRAANYGAVLQAYSLKCVCENLGYEVHIINYTYGMRDNNPQPIKEFLQTDNKKNALFKFIRNSLSYVWDKKRWDEFVAFRKKYLNETHECATKKELEELGFDAYIVGSDQIWNYNITGNAFDPVYFADFAHDSTRVVYAASSHDTPFPLDKELEFKDLLSHTNSTIGIREQKLADYVGSITGIKYPVVLDPTLLAGKEIIENIVNDYVPKKPYILIYQIDSNPNSDISVKNLENYFGYKVYTMTVPRIGSIYGRKGFLGPEKFLSLLKNAEFLVTNSFHGIALSLLFEKQFFVYENNGVMSRIDNLLDSVKLYNRKVKMVSDIDLNNIINYCDVNKHLDFLRELSHAFLTDALLGKKTDLQYYSKENFYLKSFSERKKEDCSGCSACAKLCPVHAITMKPDNEGFLYPVIDNNKCINCNKCDNICSFKPTNLSYKLPLAYGVKHLDIETRISSRSGGAFIAFSNYILQQNGVIYGAAMQSDFNVKLIRATTVSDRDLMKNAKYVQSDPDDVFNSVRLDLQTDKYVLFTGTPCQVSGLYCYLNERNIDIQKLYTCDLVCHGVPSPMVWKDYLDFIQSKYKQKIIVANFRDKSFGWDSHYESFILNNKKKIVRKDFTDLFYEHIILRPSCHKCHFANVNRISDLTLADFWGIEKNKPEFDDNKGVSLVLVNTNKGKELFNNSINELEFFECNIKNCIQPTLIKPSLPSARRNDFWNDYANIRFDVLIKKYTTPNSVLPRIKKILKQIMYKFGIRNHP